jgi:hypothetical protein
MLDPLLLQVSLTPSRRVFRDRLEKLSREYHVSIQALYQRLKFLGLFYVEARMGPKALDCWLNHMKQIIRLYEGNIVLYSKAVNRYEDVQRDLHAFLEESFGDISAARLFQVSVACLRFWADTLGALNRDHCGRFTGREIRRFWEEDKHLLVAIKIGQRRKEIQKSKQQPAKKE